MKHFYLIVLTVFLCIVLASCADSNKPGEINDSIDSTHTNPHHRVAYDTLEDLQRSLQYDYGASQFSAMAVAEGQEIADNLEYFIRTMKGAGVPVPHQDGTPIDLRDEEGFSNITLFLNEAHDLPWIWVYPPTPSESRGGTIITYTALPKGMDPAATPSEILKQLAPQYPNLDNYEEVANVVNVSERSLALADRTVKALYIDYNYETDGRDWIWFVYDELWVCVRYDPNAVTDAWFAALSFE